jgi:hypothetical protein
MATLAFIVVVGTALLFVYLLIHTPPDGKGCGFALIGAAVGAVFGGGIGYAFAVEGLKTIRGEGWGAGVEGAAYLYLVSFGLVLGGLLGALVGLITGFRSNDSHPSKTKSKKRPGRRGKGDSRLD